jgi:outer membrane immunogenic protein
VRCKLLILTAVMLSASGARLASAADMVVKTPVLPAPVAAYNWGGLYIGGNVGYGWGAPSNPGLSFVDPGAVANFAGYFAAGGNVTPNLNPSGLIGGGQIGFDWMLSPSLVAGVVTDFQGPGIKDSATNTVTPPGFLTSLQSNSEQIDWFGTFRAKLGFAQNNWLLYATGGLAYGRVATSGCICFGTVAGVPLNFTGSNNTTNVGWAAGAGLNYGLTSNWIVGIEYLYVDLGSASYVETTANPGAPASSVTINNRASVQIARVSLDYKF